MNPEFGKAKAEPTCYEFSDFRLDLVRGFLFRGNQEILLRPKSFEVLKCLVAGRGRLVTRTELLETVWRDVAVSDESITKCVADIRKALGDQSQEIIRTIKGRGFLLEPEVRVTYPATPGSPSGPPVAAARRPLTFEASAPHGIAPLPVAGRREVRPLWAIGLALALVLVSSGSHELRPVLPFQARDWVLVDGFENRTGETLLDGTIPAALERELSNSEFVSVVPRERVEDTLRLMRIPVGATLNVAQAREVCLRDGGIRALVTGRTERLGSTYLLSAEIIDPVQGLTVAADTEAAAGQNQIWPAVRRLSNWVRQTLGESMERIERSNRQLEKVTTPSLKALQLFTDANAASRHGQWAISAQLLRQALIDDPGFASAHLWLAFALGNLNDPESKREIERARALAGTVSERERYFIQGTYEGMMGHPERAIPSLEALVRRYPDHYWAYPNLAIAYLNAGQIERAGDIAARFADARPNDPTANAMAAVYNERIDLAKARPYARRTVELGPESTDANFWENALLFHAHDLWMQDDAKGALAELDRIAGHPKDWSDPRVRRLVALDLAGMYLTLGKFQSSEEWFDSLGTDAPVWHSLISFLKTPLEDRRATLLPPDWKARYPNPQPWMRGDDLRMHGRAREAAVLIQPAFDAFFRQHSPLVQFNGDRLVAALEDSGNSKKALEVLKATSATRPWIAPGLVAYGAFWLRDQARLSAYYHRMGREPDARKIDDQLQKLLAVADSDHPILRQLRELSH